MSGLRQIVLIGAVLGVGIGGAKLQAQTQLADPKDAPKIFASTCSACHKSPQGLAKSGQVAGFLRQHYTTGPEMSAAMAAYLVAAGSAPPAKKGAATASADGASAKDRPTKGKKQEQASATPGTEQPDQRTLRGKQRQTKSDEPPAVHAPAAPATTGQPTSAEPIRQAAAPVAAAAAAEAIPAAPAQDAGPPPVVFDVPIPEMPVAPPADLTPQSVFSSSPLP